jgi:hypothetical protein
MACTPFTNTRSQIGVLRFSGSHLASTSFKIATAESSDTVVAGTRRRMDDCERPTVSARRVNWSSGTGPLRRERRDIGRGRTVPLLSQSSKTHILVRVQLHMSAWVIHIAVGKLARHSPQHPREPHRTRRDAWRPCESIRPPCRQVVALGRAARYCLARSVQCDERRHGTELQGDIHS